MTPLEKAAAAAEAADMDHGSDEMWGVKVARAVLMAVREPTPEMLAAGGFVETGSENHYMSEEIWTEMIDAILAEEPK